MLRASFRVNSLRARSALVQTRTAATRFVWTAVILNSSDTSGLFSNGTFKPTVNGAYKIFWRPKGGSSESHRIPPAYGPGCYVASKFKKQLHFSPYLGAMQP